MYIKTILHYCISVGKNNWIMTTKLCLHATCAYRLHAIASTAAITLNSYHIPIRGYFDIFRLQNGWDNSSESTNLKILSITPTSYSEYMINFSIDKKWKDLFKMYFDIE